MFQLLRLGFRLLIFLLLVTVGISVYLIKRPDTPSFYNKLRADLRSGLSASEVAVRGVRRMQGQLEVRRLGGRRGRGNVFHLAGSEEHPLQNGAARWLAGHLATRHYFR